VFGVIGARLNAGVRAQQLSMPKITSKNPIKWTAVISIAVSTITVIAVAASTAKSVQQVYADFGVAVPTLTRFAYRCYPYTVLSFVLIWLIQRLTERGIGESIDNRKLVISLTIGVVAYTAWLVVIGVGLYLPHHIFGRLR
jgi:hypothetical protein